MEPLRQTYKDYFQNTNMNALKIIQKTIASYNLYLSEVFLQNFAILLQAVIALSLGNYFNSISKEYTIAGLMTYYLGVILINTFQRNSCIREFEQEVLSGNVATLLIKPVNFIYYKILKEFAGKLYYVLINFITLLIIIIIFVAIPEFSLGILLRGIFILPITILYYYIILAIFLYLALFLENVSDLYRVFGMTAFFIGGGLVPTSNFPSLLTYFPTQFLFGSPLEFLIKGTYTNVFWFIGYFVLFTGIMLILNKYAFRRLEINGG